MDYDEVRTLGDCLEAARRKEEASIVALTVALANALDAKCARLEAWDSFCQLQNPKHPPNRYLKMLRERRTRCRSIAYFTLGENLLTRWMF